MGTLATLGAMLTPTLVPSRYFQIYIDKLMGPFDRHCMSYSTYIPFSQKMSPGFLKSQESNIQKVNKVELLTFSQTA
jgi:hypothetical protein